MANTDEEPIRLNTATLTKRSYLPFTQKTPLPKPSSIKTSFNLALIKRRSAEDFIPVASSDLAAWLYYTASVQSVNSDDPNRQRCFVASFGALHPAHIILGSPDGKWSAYIPQEHALGDLIVDEKAASELRIKAIQLYSSREATLVGLISDRDLVGNYYANASALMLRDAGVLVGHGALVAAALGLAFRILGSSGGRPLENLVRNLPFHPMAAGLALIGRGKKIK
jgi:hypothetical protein